MPYNVDEEIELLSGHIKRLGKEEGEIYQVTFKVVCKMIWATYNKIFIQELFVDDQVANTLESLAGTLKAAKKKAVVSYGPELLLQVLQHFMLMCIEVGLSGNVYIKYIILPLSNTVPVFIILYSLQGMSDSVIITLKKWFLKMCFYVSLHCVL